MQRLSIVLLAAVVTQVATQVLAQGCSGVGLMASAGNSTWKLLFEDQFPVDAASPTGVNPQVWTFDIGDRDLSDPSKPGPERWGNGEPQYYTDRCALHTKLTGLHCQTALHRLNTTLTGAHCTLPDSTTWL
jgi:hypothetical protein